MQLMVIAIILCVIGIAMIVIGIVTPLPLLVTGCIGVLCLLAGVILSFEGKGRQ